MRKIYWILFPLFISIFWASVSLSATIICDEDFENVTPGQVPEIDPTGSGQISTAARTFYGSDGDANGAFLSSGGNPGQCARAYIGPYTNDKSYCEPKWRFDNKFNNSKEIYIKFDLRIDANLGTSNATREVSDFKIIRITDYSDASASSSDEWHPQINFTPSSSGYRWYTWSEGSGYSEYYFSRASTIGENHMMDNSWHTYEIYIHIGQAVVSGRDDTSADGIVRIWEDGVLILEDTSVPFRTSSSEGQGINSIAFIRHAKSLGAPVDGMEGNLYFDNLLVYNGMPDSTDGDSDDDSGSEDSTAPGATEEFSSTPGYRQAELNWVNPSDSDFAGTMIRYTTNGTYPGSQSEGTLVCNQTGTAGASQSYTVTNLQLGLTYYFSAFSYDESGNYSEAVNASAIMGPAGLEVIGVSSN